MKARELIEYLSLNPEAEVLVVRTWYNGGDDEREAWHPQVVTDGDEFLITPAMPYERQFAVEYFTPGAAPADKRKAESEDPVIYMDYWG